MTTLQDRKIKSWIQNQEHFEQRGDGGGLFLCFRETMTLPVWKFRYRLGGTRSVMTLGSYGTLSLAGARKQAKELRSRVSLGYDVAQEKQQRIADAADRKSENKKHAFTAGQLADEYFAKHILGRWKHPNIIRSRIERDLKPHIGKLPVDQVKPMHIAALLQSIVDRGAPTSANVVLRLSKAIFDYAIKRHIVEFNPASAFAVADAGGNVQARDRALSRDELVMLYQAMKTTKGFSSINELTIKLLLMLGVRKNELITAKIEAFDLANSTWQLTTADTKTRQEILIPLPSQAVDALRDLTRLAAGSDYLLPARQYQDRRFPHISESTINVALAKVKANMVSVHPFTVHDFRRTARTHLAALGVDSHIAERCLNHKLKGVEGVYNRHDYFEERKAALQKLANFLEACELGKPWNVSPIRKRL